MIIDFSKSVAAGRVAAEETRKLAAELALANAMGAWRPEEHNKLAVEALASAAGYMLQTIGVLEAVNGQMQEMFGEKPQGGPPPAGELAPEAVGTGVAKQLLDLILKGAAAQRAEKPRLPDPAG
jgi:hypothetical protein